jgi:hypothetical protein
MVNCSRLAKLCAQSGRLDLKKEEAWEIADHLGECPECREAFGGDARLRHIIAPTEDTDGPLSYRKTRVSPPVSQDDTEVICLVPDETVGRQIGGFRILAPLGRGGMGVVYKAYQVGMDRKVALKLLAPHLADDASFVERFFREARAAAKLRHPNIVQAYDCGDAEGSHYLALEYVDGQSLRSILERKGALPPPMVVDYAKQICGALAAAHKAGIIHRDIKPDNLLVDREGAIRVLDFGLAKAPERDASLTTDGHVMGTPIYLSPEMAAGNDIDGRTDLYSLGVTMYQLLSGRPPFLGKSFSEIVIKHAHQTPPALHTVAPTVDRRLCRIVDRLLSKAPADRQASAAELLADLDALGNLAPAEEEEAGGRRRFPFTLPRPRLLLLLATAAVLTAVLAWRSLESADKWVAGSAETVLFGGQSLQGWDVVGQFPVPETDGSGAGGSVSLKDGALVLGPGNPLTGAEWTGVAPRMNYEITFEARRISGSQDFCLAFPVNDSACLLQAGGWMNDLLGLDELDGLHAPENGTGQRFELEQGRWYRFVLRVAAGDLTVGVDGRTLIDFPLAGHTFTLDPKWRNMRVPGVGSAWSTTAAFRDIRLRTIRDGGDSSSDPVVTAAAVWQSSGLRMAQGQRWRLRARGIWGGLAGSLAGPEGSLLSAEAPFPLPGASEFSLIGRIGESGAPFEIGAGTSFTAENDGELFLRMNDHSNQDNVGSVRVTAERDSGSG